MCLGCFFQTAIVKCGCRIMKRFFMVILIVLLYTYEIKYKNLYSTKHFGYQFVILTHFMQLPRWQVSLSPSTPPYDVVTPPPTGKSWIRHCSRIDSESQTGLTHSYSTRNLTKNLIPTEFHIFVQIQYKSSKITHCSTTANR